MKLGLDRIEKVARDITTHYIRATLITEREGKSKNYYVNLSDCFQKHTEHMNHDDKRRVFIMMVQRNYITEKDHTERGDMEQYFTRLESVKLSSENYS